MSHVSDNHLTIAKFWLGKYITQAGGIVNEFKSTSIPVHYDLGEPCCWACGLPVVSKEEQDERTVEEIWKSQYVTSHLERCHIVAESLGGSGTADNLFLMCKRCHIESPDVKNKRAFFRWVYDRRHKYVYGGPNISYIKELIDNELKRRDLISFQELFQTLSTEDQERFSHEFTGNWLNPHAKDPVPINQGLHNAVMSNFTQDFGQPVSHESMVIAFVDYIIEKYNDKILNCQ